MMATTSRHVDSPHASGDADALHKMAAAAAREAGHDENKPANANKPPTKKSSMKEEPKQQSESDDEDADDGDDDDDESGDKTKSAVSSVADKCDDDDKKTSKKSRRELPPHTVAILKGWMLSPEHVKHPYPTDEDKQMLLKKTGINMKQLTNWFTNARKRIWKPMMRREHSRQLQSAMEYEKTRGVPEGYPGGPPMPYREGPYPPRPSLRHHSFDAGSLGVPPQDPQMPAYHHPYDVPPHAYPGPPPPHAYPPRVMRSVSESATAHEVDDYIDAMRIRKRVHEMSPDGVEADGMAHADKRFRRVPQAMLSPRCMKILQDWVAAHSHMEYPLPADSDKLQLSRDTGLDVQQIELWFKNNVGRYGAPLQAPPQPTPQQAPQPLPHGHPAYRSAPSRDNPMYPPPPAYGERRSIPTQGNSMFPPRPAVRSSIPGAGNPQFPPPPALRRENSEGYRQGMPPSYPGGVYPPPQHNQGFRDGDPARPMRTLSINSGYAHAAASQGQGPPQVAMPTPVGAPGPGGSASGLPSLTGRPMPSASRGGPPVGQARDSRSHTLDMGQFAEARRRTMNFQDILASTSSQPVAPAPVAPRPLPGGGVYDATRPPNAENIYPTEVGGPYAQKMFEQQRSAMMAAASHPGNGAVEPHGSARI